MKTARLTTGETVKILTARPENGRVKVMGTGSSDGEVWSVPESDIVNNETINSEV
jgi:hypothetical protein